MWLNYIELYQLASNFFIPLHPENESHSRTIEFVSHHIQLPRSCMECCNTWVQFKVLAFRERCLCSVLTEWVQHKRLWKVVKIRHFEAWTRWVDWDLSLLRGNLEGLRQKAVDKKPQLTGQKELVLRALGLCKFWCHKCSSLQVFKLMLLMHLILHFMCTSLILRWLDKVQMSE